MNIELEIYNFDLREELFDQFSKWSITDYEVFCKVDNLGFFKSFKISLDFVDSWIAKQFETEIDNKGSF